MRTLANTKRVLTELFRDKRTLALMFLAPILIMWLMNVMFSANSNTKVDIATVNVSQSIRTNLKKVDGVTVTTTSNRQARQRLRNNSTDAIIKYDRSQNRHSVTYANTDSSKTALTKQALRSDITASTINTLSHRVRQLQGVIKATSPNIPLPEQASYTPTISNHYQYGDGDTVFLPRSCRS